MQCDTFFQQTGHTVPSIPIELPTDSAQLTFLRENPELCMVFQVWPMY
jgi:hypothetical protein